MAEMNVLPQCVIEYVELVAKKIRYRRRVRQEVMAELLDHFTDALRDIEDQQERQAAAQRLIETFGDPKLLAQLIRRGKKRCRPLWKKAIIRSFQTIGLLLLLIVSYAFWTLHQTPTIKTDYFQRINEIRRPVVAQTENGWPHYAQAIELYVPPPNDLAGMIKNMKSDDWHGEEDRIKQWLAENAPAWQELQAGSKVAHAWYEYEPTEEGLLTVLLPQLGPLRDVTKVGIWQARFKAADGDTTGALEDCMTAARVGRHLQGRGTLIEQLVGIAIGTLARHDILKIVGEHDVDAARLERVALQLKRLYADGYPQMDMAFEEISMMDTVQRCFSDGGIGGGHLLPKQFLELMQMCGADFDTGLEVRLVQEWAMAGAGMVHARRDETVAQALAYYRELKERGDMTPYDVKASGKPSLDDKLEAMSTPRYFFLKVLLPALERAMAMDHQFRTHHQATLAVLALQRRHEATGAYPDDLQTLVTEGYLKALPRDPYAAGPLRYERRADSFVLYSLGRDFDDDGGTQTQDDDWGRKEPGGDRVFWK